MSQDGEVPIIADSVEIILGDCREELKNLPDKSVQCCVTSPPYLGLRDYQHADQIGLEKIPNEYVTELVSVFRELWRVMRDDGTFWLNLGDSYAGGGGGNYGTGKNVVSQGGQQVTNVRNRPDWLNAAGVKSKDLLMIPAMVAIALRNDGWYLRSSTIWHKTNPMPESVKDRPTSAHEHVFLLTKSQKYYYDAAAIAEATICTKRRGPALHADVISTNGNSGLSRRPIKDKKNSRNVWTMPSHSFRGAHFATMPPELAERCIKAGSKPGDTILDPFSGAGTTGLIAKRLGRKAILIELNPDYVKLARDRIDNDPAHNNAAINTTLAKSISSSSSDQFDIFAEGLISIKR